MSLDRCYMLLPRPFFSFQAKHDVELELSDNQINLVNQMFTRYNVEKGGYGKAIIRVPLYNFIRKPKDIEN